MLSVALIPCGMYWNDGPLWLCRSEPSQDDLEDVEEDDETILVRVRKPDGNVFRARLELVCGTCLPAGGL